MSAVNVVAQHDDKVEPNHLPVSLHLLCHIVLVVIAGPAVANHRKTHGLLLKRKFDLQFGGRLRIQIVPGDNGKNDEQQYWPYRTHGIYIGKALGT